MCQFHHFFRQLSRLSHLPRLSHLSHLSSRSSHQSRLDDICHHVNTSIISTASSKMLRLHVSDFAYLSAGVAIALKTWLPSSDNAFMPLLLLTCTLAAVNLLLAFFELCVSLFRLGRPLQIVRITQKLVAWDPFALRMQPILVIAGLCVFWTFESTESKKHRFMMNYNYYGRSGGGGDLVYFRDYLFAICRDVDGSIGQPVIRHDTGRTLVLENQCLRTRCYLRSYRKPPQTIIGTKPAQTQQQLQKLPRQDVDERCCKLCYDADANSIVLSCGHVDLCVACLSSLAARAQRECPENETWCQLAGSVHVHCLVCRGGGERRKVFFA